MPPREVAVPFPGQYNPRMHVPELDPSVPSRGNVFSRTLGRTALGLSGWRMEGMLPPLPKFVVIVAPHTSNWDFFVGIGAVFALGLRISFLGKDSLFRGLQGPIMRWLGGIAVDRSVSRDRVAEMVEVFRSRDRLVVGVTPEGTRKKVADWKTGFYHVAKGANVPILPVAFDYSRKKIIFFPAFTPTGDAKRDIEFLKGLFQPAMARRTGNFWVTAEG
jgi:1-acyl-sn-glycerol-3-phosphate acyltransferase